MYPLGDFGTITKFYSFAQMLHAKYQIILYAFCSPLRYHILLLVLGVKNFL